MTYFPPTVDSSSALRVLVVDDEFLIRWSLVETLSECGHVVAEAGDAETTLRTIGESPRPPDVVLLDYRLPDPSDLGLLAAIRREVPTAQVIVMTAHGFTEIAARALELGAYRVVGKPFSVHELVALVAEAHAAAH